MINHIKFALMMIQKYEKIYTQLPLNIIVDIIDTVLLRAPDLYFTWEQVQDNPQLCKKCGACCRTLNCQYFNGRTCEEYATRFDACVEFPWYEINNETGLILDPSCGFAVSLAEKILTKEFERNLELLGVNEDEN